MFMWKPPVKTAVAIGVAVDTHLVENERQRSGGKQHISGSTRISHRPIIDPVGVDIMQRYGQRQSRRDQTTGIQSLVDHALQTVLLEQTLGTDAVANGLCNYAACRHRSQLCCKPRNILQGQHVAALDVQPHVTRLFELVLRDHGTVKATDRRASNSTQLTIQLHIPHRLPYANLISPLSTTA